MSTTEIREEPVLSDAELEEDLARLRSMLPQRDIEGARALVKELEKKWPDSEQVQYFARVLAPPVARSLTTRSGRPMNVEFAWLRAHGREYPGCWLAIYGNGLVAADPSLKRVQEEARRVHPDESVLLFYQAAEQPDP